METTLMTLFTRAPLHVGAGSSVGAVDQPIVRERHTRFPVIPGSSLKGVLADLWNEPGTGKGAETTIRRSDEGRLLFGNDDPKNARAGKLLIGEAKLLAFPVRSARGCFAWITCPMVLKRFAREKKVAYKVADMPTFENEQVLVPSGSVIATTSKTTVILEEYPLDIKKPGESWAAEVASELQSFCADEIWKTLPQRLAIVSDELFAYFVENTCEIAHHNRIDDATSVVDGNALFNQENVPSETVFYAVIRAEDQKHIGEFQDKIEKDQNKLIQIGADITTGLGWCSVQFNDKEAK